MKRVSNWLFGGFFRTIGRTLAFLLIGALIGLIAYKNDISLYKLLGIETVSASTVNTTSVKYRLYWYEYGYSSQAGNSSYTSAGTGTDLGNNKLVYSFNTIINTSSNLVAGRKYKIVLTYTLSPTGNKWQNNYKKDTTFLFSGSTDGSNWNDGYIEEATSSIKPNCETCDRNTATFYITPNTNINYLRIIMRIPKNDRSNSDFNLNDTYKWTYANLPAGEYIKISYTTDEGAIATQEQTTVIQDQTDLIIQGQEEIKDTLLDDNISDSDYSDKLDDLDIDNDTWQGPFSAFLLLPLNWVQNILASNQVCQPINLPIPFTNSTLTLPCMTEFWSRLGALSTLIQLCWLAVVGVRIFNGLFVLTVEVTSAKGNADELTKIRSWEL